ncbi:O-antigen polymerase [Vibrio vulnificus]|nr:oligosaccharide repeat unit polymerase [Vibrio vulnificus]MCU8289864.1 oligosaccharide repeat unit polymerase [Vibrio vulnificus]
MNNVYFIDSIYALLGSLSLFLTCSTAYFVTRSVFSPAVIFPLTWAIALLFLSCVTPFLGFYQITSWSIVVFVTGGMLFSVVSCIITKVFHINEKVFFSMTLDDIDYAGIVKFFYVGVLLTSPVVFVALMNYGDDIVQIASRIRYERIHGEGNITPGVVQNWFLLAFFLIFIIFAGVLKGKVKLLYVVFPIVVTLVLYLILEGRSSIIMQVFAWFFLMVYIKNGIGLKGLGFVTSALLFFIVLGSFFVSKVKVNDMTIMQEFFLYLKHILSYLYQGPILFSRYYDGSINIRENWNALNSFFHILKNLGLYSGDISQHADFRRFGYGADDVGNVYSIYFSILPHYTYIGACFFITIYSMIATVFYNLSRFGGVFSLYVSGILFSSSLLSVFMDGFGYLLYFFMKIFIFFMLINVFFNKKIKLGFKK